MSEQLISQAKKYLQNDDGLSAIQTLMKSNLEIDPNTNYLLGYIYINGNDYSGTKKDIRNGKKHLLRSLELGNADAGLELASLYYLGNGVKENEKLAEKYWQMSWDLGDELAGFELANYYFDHQLKLDKAVVIYNELIAMDEFVDNSHYKLFKIYESGFETIEKDPKRALKHLEESANNQGVNACMTLGLKYYRGEEVSKDREKAIELVSRVKDNDLFKQEIEAILNKMYQNEDL
ncbi:sel1 repeat family protein [Flammeovirga sp. MY04]|uniref:tetratricopeptide repeat protein n=1 Tax=Flammeovirga sp. MY04 TaxID=1191459 RepID=UPI0008061DD8|nr:tetratricopeptide repeat protein [Flammeovirga sp. MY04]ANQ48570.1 sel1 repeat family protein [Flammeovirga sp. MY04]